MTMEPVRILLFNYCGTSGGAESSHRGESVEMPFMQLGTIVTPPQPGQFVYSITMEAVKRWCRERESLLNL